MRPRLYTATCVILLAVIIALVYAVYNIPACPTEDSLNCYWDASTQGNHLGRSFWALGTETYYLIFFTS